MEFWVILGVELRALHWVSEDTISWAIPLALHGVLTKCGQKIFSVCTLLSSVGAEKLSVSLKLSSVVSPENCIPMDTKGLLYFVYASMYLFCLLLWVLIKKAYSMYLKLKHCISLSPQFNDNYLSGKSSRWW
jgi:hypothetical protein